MKYKRVVVLPVTLVAIVPSASLQWVQQPFDLLTGWNSVHFGLTNS